MVTQPKADRFKGSLTTSFSFVGIIIVQMVELLALTSRTRKRFKTLTGYPFMVTTNSTKFNQILPVSPRLPNKNKLYDVVKEHIIPWNNECDLHFWKVRSVSHHIYESFPQMESCWRQRSKLVTLNNCFISEKF